MTFLEQIELAEDGEFQARVRQAAITAAAAIMADQPDNTPQAIAAHALRAKLALEVLRNPSAWARPIAAAVVTNAAVTAESTDSDLQWTVNSLWDALAGIVLEPELA
jgi:hypothetical protein